MPTLTKAAANAGHEVDGVRPTLDFAFPGDFKMPIAGSETFRYVYMLAGLRRDEPVRDGHGDNMQMLVETVWELQVPLLGREPG